MVNLGEKKVPEVSSLNISKFFSGDERTFKIPDYQREYAWESDEEVEALCSDLYGFFESDEEYYLLGQSIIAHNSDPKDKRDYPLAVVDGQQRLTTLFLFMIAARDYLRPHLEITAVQEVSKVLDKVINATNHETFKPVIRLRSSDTGHMYITNLIEGKSLPEDGHANTTQRNIAENYDFILSFFKAKLESPTKFVDFARKVLTQVFIIETRLASQEHALDIFEKLNNRGRPLNSADLLKNLLFQQASINDYAKISDKWYEAAKNVFAVRPHKAASMEYLMKSLLGEKLGQGISNREVFKSWKSHLEGNVNMVSFAGDLAKAAAYFKNIGSTVHTKENEFLFGSRFFGTVQHFPLAIAGRGLKHEPENLEFLYRLIDARVLLSLYSEEKSQSLDLTVWPWVKKIASMSNPDIDSIYEISKSAFEPQAELIELGSVIFSRLNYQKTKDRKRILFALSLITNEFEIQTGAQKSISATRVHLEAYKNRGYHLDHIFPQALVPSEPNEADEYSWIHQPGNIALLNGKDNGQIQAAHPNKKSKLYLSSAIILTQALAKKEDNNLAGVVNAVVNKAHEEGHPTVDEWSQESVQKRNAYLWDKFSSRLRLETIFAEHSH
jgi:uncharacterized protein with ParB-like and HNH nuclease domain